MSGAFSEDVLIQQSNSSIGADAPAAAEAKPPSRILPQWGITMIKILFICHGNICRSVSAQYILQKTGTCGKT